MVFLCFFVYGQSLILDDKNDNTGVIITKIDQDRAELKKFFTSEIESQRQLFFSEMNDRANYYEEALNDIIRTAVWKLGLLFGSMIFFFTSFNMFLKSKMEKKKYLKLERSVIEAVKREIPTYNSQNKQSFEQNKTIIKDHNAVINTQSLLNPPLPPKHSESKRERKKRMKLEKKAEIFREQLNKVQEQQASLKGNKTPMMPDSPMVEPEYSFNVEVNYND